LGDQLAGIGLGQTLLDRCTQGRNVGKLSPGCVAGQGVDECMSGLFEGFCLHRTRTRWVLLRGSVAGNQSEIGSAK
jgi:hypothetical protein